jgi:hypothetical protein
MAFCTNIDKATPTNFQLVFPMLPPQVGLKANNELLLNLQGVVMPSVSISPLEINWQGAKRQVAGTPVEFEQMNVQFIVDSHFKNWQLIYEWMMHISNNKDKMIDYYSEYAVDSALSVHDNFQSEILRIGFTGMWPVNLQEVSFSTREAEVTIECSATFIYDYFELK